MSRQDIVRAWKDEEYFNGLSESERSLLPQNPAGVIELKDQDLCQAEGGTTISLTIGCFTILSPLCTITISDDQLD